MDWLIEYQRRLAEQVEPWGKQAVLIFRGQSDESWKLDSSADRRLEKEAQPLSLIEYLTKVLIEPAKSEGYAHQQNKELNDLELLAKLQHYGAATCLIDFTANFHIALWFACADDQTDGKIFVVNRGSTQNFKEITPESAKKRIAELLQPQPTTQQTPSEVPPEKAKKRIAELLQPQTVSSESQPEIYYWKPPANENRIVVQHSCFIFSAQPIKPEIYKEICISKEHKQEIRTLLQKYHGLDSQSIFRDFGGFAASQGQDRPITPIDPTSEEQLLLSGNRHFQQGKYDEALEDYNEVIRINPQDGEAYNNRGTTKDMLGRHEEALEDYNEAIRINSQFAEAYYNRGTTKDVLGRHEEAIVDYDQAIRINPQYAQAYYNRGNTKDTLDRHEEAIADFNEAIRINSQYAQAYCNRGTVKLAQGQHDDAIADYDQAIRINSQFTQAYYNRGIAKSMLRRFEDAITDFNEAIRINPQDAKVYTNRGNATAALGRYHDAIADYDQVIRINPQDAVAYYNRGITHKEIEEYEKARADFQRTFELATEQGNQALAQDAQRLLSELSPAGGED